MPRRLLHSGACVLAVCLALAVACWPFEFPTVPTGSGLHYSNSVHTSADGEQSGAVLRQSPGQNTPAVALTETTRGQTHSPWRDSAPGTCHISTAAPSACNFPLNTSGQATSRSRPSRVRLHVLLCTWLT